MRKVRMFEKGQDSHNPWVVGFNVQVILQLHASS
jgi:hypothetical protein